MALDEDELREAGRRARAAAAYAGIDDKVIAQVLSLSVPTLQRIYTGLRKQTDWGDLWKIADACGVPREWFSADISRLAAIVAAGKPAFPSPDQRAAARAREARALQERAQQQRARRKAERGTTRSPRGHRAQGA